MFRVLTVAREYGSGGAQIAKIVAERLKWRLLDHALVTKIAQAARVDPALARRYDEHVDSWLHRVSRRALWYGGFEGVASVRPTDVFDAEAEAALARSVIEEAHRQGECVIVGRGAQCVLQNRPDVFHVFVYAPMAEKLARVRRRVAEEDDAGEMIRATDAERAEYVRLNFGSDWNNPHLYHLLIDSELGEKVTAAAIMCAMQAAAGERPCGS